MLVECWRKPTVAGENRCKQRLDMQTKNAGVQPGNSNFRKLFQPLVGTILYFQSLVTHWSIVGAVFFIGKSRRPYPWTSPVLPQRGHRSVPKLAMERRVSVSTICLGVSSRLNRKLSWRKPKQLPKTPHLAHLPIRMRPDTLQRKFIPSISVHFLVFG